ncbi:MAG: hypothetical protein WCL51_12460 [Bacteroidota bacterium]
MDLQTKKINFIQEFLRINSEELIKKLDNLLHSEKRRIYEQDLKPMSIESFNAAIDQSEEDVENGRVVNARELRKDIEEWK